MIKVLASTSLNTKFGEFTETLFYDGQAETIALHMGQLNGAEKLICRMHSASKGYQQRVGIAAAILHNPEVLILDEPTTGLDPNQLQEIRSLIKVLGQDKTILFSTHIMQEVEAICDRVIIIKKGKLLLDKSHKERKQSNQQKIEVTFDAEVKQKVLKELSDLVSIENLSGNSWQLTFDSKEDQRSTIFDFAQENGLKILELNSKNQSLETLFKEVTN